MLQQLRGAPQCTVGSASLQTGHLLQGSALRREGSCSLQLVLPAAGPPSISSYQQRRGLFSTARRPVLSPSSVPLWPSSLRFWLSPRLLWTSEGRKCLLIALWAGMEEALPVPTLVFGTGGLAPGLQALSDLKVATYWHLSLFLREIHMPPAAIHDLEAWPQPFSKI